MGAMELDLSRLIDALPGLVWTALPDGRADFINRRWCEYTGLEPQHALGFGWHGAIHHEDRSRVLGQWHSFVASGQSGEVLTRLRRYDGEYRRFLFRAVPITGASGQVVKWCGVNTEVESLTGEAELRRAYAHFSVAQRLSATGSFIADLAADEHTWSDELYRIFELDPSLEPRRQSVRNLIHPHDLPAYDAMIERGVAGNDVDFEFRILTARGALKYLRGAARVSEHVVGRPVLMGAVQDVTQLRQAHEHLTEAQRLSKTGSYTADLVQDYHAWSDEFYRICEFEIGSPVTIQTLRDIVVPEDVPAFEGAMARAFAGEDPHFSFRIVTASGAVKHLHGVAHRSEQIAGRPIFIGAVQDVTEGKVAEESLNKARAELTHVARVMTLGALTASIAHEVNQPLAGIITNASTCLRMLAADPPNLDGARATAQRTLRDGNRASEVIERLRTLFARKEPKTESVDLNDAAREVLALSSSELQRNRVMLQTDFAQELPLVSGDRIQLQQVILNLTLNAVDAMKEIDDRPRALRVTTVREDSSHVRLSIRDCGVGIDPQQTEKLFEAFYTTKSHGMGIGLSISRSIIESHAGRLWASANDGPGATFSFSLPCR
jgi:signal transduction histidine kinase